MKRNYESENQIRVTKRNFDSIKKVEIQCINNKNIKLVMKPRSTKSGHIDRYFAYISDCKISKNDKNIIKFLEKICNCCNLIRNKYEQLLILSETVRLNNYIFCTKIERI